MILERCQNGFKMRRLNDVSEEDNTVQIESNIKCAQEIDRVSEPQTGLVPHRTEPTNEGTCFFFFTCYLISLGLRYCTKIWLYGTRI